MYICSFLVFHLVLVSSIVRYIWRVLGDARPRWMTLLGLRKFVPSNEGFEIIAKDIDTTIGNVFVNKLLACAVQIL